MITRPLRRNDPEPAWAQITRRLRHEIAEQPTPHERFPSESELARSFGVSRVTVRRALSELTRSGELYTRPGKGTFVAPTHLQASLGALTGFSEKMRRLGLDVDTRVLSSSVTDIGGEVAAQFGHDRMRVLQIKRLRIVGSVPTALQVCYIAPNHYVPLLDADLTTSLTTLLRERAGVTMVSADERIEARTPSRADADALGMPSHIPVLRLTSVAHTASGEPVRLTVSQYRSDVIRFTFRSLLSTGPQLTFDVVPSDNNQ